MKFIKIAHKYEQEHVTKLMTHFDIKKYYGKLRFQLPDNGIF